MTNPERNYYRNGQLESEIWRVDGKYYRLNGPAYQTWHENGQLASEDWIVDGIYHRLNGPAVRWSDENGHLRFEEWWINGKQHQPEDHPFNVFGKEHNLSSTYNDWPEDMKVLFEMTYK